LGAIGSLADRAGVPLQESFSRRLEQIRTTATRLSPLAAEVALAEGKALTLEQVIDEALRQEGVAIG
jgi:hypothetical protein